MLVLGCFCLRLRFRSAVFSGQGSPFTIAHANQIRIIAWLFLTGFVLGILISSGFVSVANAGGFHIGLASDESANYSVISIDVKSVVGAVVCFSLSSVWK